MHLLPLKKKLVKPFYNGTKQIFSFMQMNTISMTKDKKQENFSEYKTWKEFNDSRDFNWIENEFIEPKI